MTYTREFEVVNVEVYGEYSSPESRAERNGSRADSSLAGGSGQLPSRCWYSPCARRPRRRVALVTASSALAIGRHLPVLLSSVQLRRTTSFATSSWPLTCPKSSCNRGHFAASMRSCQTSTAQTMHAVVEQHLYTATDPIRIDARARCAVCLVSLLALVAVVLFPSARFPYFRLTCS